MATERQIYWQGIIDEHVASGLTKADFFKLNNINPATYYYCQHFAPIIHLAMN